MAGIGGWNTSHKENRYVVRYSLSLDLLKISSACLLELIFACAKYI